LSGCASFSAPSQGNNGFQLSRDCEQLAANVADPLDAGTVTVNSNPKRAVGEYRVALGEANGNLDATRTCQADQRRRLCKGRVG
jgi:hypothetical protein